MDDKTKIEACIQLYFDSLYESDTDKVRASFHDAAMVSGYLPDGLHEMNLSEFADFVGSQQPSPKSRPIVTKYSVRLAACARAQAIWRVCSSSRVGGSQAA